MNLTELFPRMTYLNLPNREDRRNDVEFRFLEQGLAVRRQPAVRASRIKDPRGYVNSRRYACGLSKCLAIRAARNAGAPAFLMFEDDVVLHPQLHEKLAQIELPEDWGMLYLGCMHRQRPIPVAPGLVRVTDAVDTHAVGFRASTYQAALTAMKGSGRGAGHRIASDAELAALHSKLPVYACFPNLAWQGVGFSSIRGVVVQNYREDGSQMTFSEAVAGLEREINQPGEGIESARTGFCEETGPLVTCVVVAWRPQNLAPILRAFRQQSIPCRTLVLLPNRLADGSLPPAGAIDDADHTMRLDCNYGSYNRLLSAFAIETPFTYFHDDDMLPGGRLLEHYVQAAGEAGDFGVLGQFGRNFCSGNYSTHCLPRTSQLEEVDCVMRSYFMHTSHLPLVLEARLSMGWNRLADRPEDDLLMAWAAKKNGKRNYITPTDSNPETLAEKEGLSELGAMHHRPEHISRRAAIVRELWG